MLKLEQLKKLVITALEDLKAGDIKVLDVRGLSNVTDLMVIASGNSDRQVKALANNVIEEAKQKGHPPIGVEGEQVGEWALVDLGDIVVHIMLPTVRDFYNLEKLWSDAGQLEVADPARAEADAKLTAGRKKSVRR